MSVGRVAKQPDESPYELQGDLWFGSDPVGCWPYQSTTPNDCYNGRPDPMWYVNHGRCPRTWYEIQNTPVEKLPDTLKNNWVRVKRRGE